MPPSALQLWHVEADGKLGADAGLQANRKLVALAMQPCRLEKQTCNHEGGREFGNKGTSACGGMRAP